MRRIARGKVAPGAREIDRSGEYPHEIFQIFRDADLLGLCIREEFGVSRTGILGLTVAIEEVAKYSKAIASMLLLGRLPTGPIMIAGSRLQQEKHPTQILNGSQKASYCLYDGQYMVGRGRNANPSDSRSRQRGR